MLELQFSSPRKRHSAGQACAQRDDSSQPPSKKRKVDHPACEAAFQPPSAFWDNLSTISLTKRSLRELDRRNAQSAPSQGDSSRRRFRRPLTRHAHTELKKIYRPFKPVSEFLRDCTVNCLKGIKRLASHGGPDLSHLRGYPQPHNPLTYTMSSSQSRSRGRKRPATSTTKKTSTSRTSTSRNTTTYDRDFQQNLVDHGIYPEEYEHPDGREALIPTNWDEINQRLTQPRASLSPSKFSDQDFKNFKRANAHAFKEKQVTNAVILIIEGKMGDGRCIAGDIPFNNLGHLTDGTIAPSKPDLFYGARPEQLDRRVRLELSNRIIPSTQDDLPMAPNFFLEAKGPDGSLAVAGRQACYDGALGARGMQDLQSYRESEPVYDDTACTITSIYHGGTLKLYTSHPVQPRQPGGQPEYYMNQLKAWAMTSDLKTFRQGATAYRNSRDWAKEKRDEFIEAANRKVANIRNASATIESSTDAEVSISGARFEVAESETSADELAFEDEEVATSFSKRTKRDSPDDDGRTGRRGRAVGTARSKSSILASETSKVGPKSILDR